MPANGVCYLRTHGNKAIPTTPDPYLSAHLIENTLPVVDPTPVVDPNPPPGPIPSKCPAADGKIATVDGIEYKLFCTLGHTQDNPNLGVSSANSFEQCMKQCCKFPYLF